MMSAVRIENVGSQTSTDKPSEVSQHAPLTLRAHLVILKDLSFCLQASYDTDPVLLGKSCRHVPPPPQGSRVSLSFQRHVSCVLSSLIPLVRSDT